MLTSDFVSDSLVTARLDCQSRVSLDALDCLCWADRFGQVLFARVQLDKCSRRSRHSTLRIVSGSDAPAVWSVSDVGAQLLPFVGMSVVEGDRVPQRTLTAN